MTQASEKIKIKIILPRFYSYMAIVFFVVSIFLGASFIYYVFGKVKIIITPSYEKLSWETTIDVHDAMGTAQSVPGKLEPFEISGDVTIPVSGEKIINEEGIGSVTIINNGDKSQPLIATTRLIAP